MELLEFSVDKELRLTSVNEALSSLCPDTVAHIGRSCYFAVLPRITLGEQEMVLQVLQEGRELSLPQVNFPSLCGVIQAKVVIQPIWDCGLVCGAQVQVQRKNSCILDERFQQLKHLVDIGKIASSLAHGVRNPLNAIKGAVVYLQRRYANESDLLEFTGIMQEEISRLDRFITDFLSASLEQSDLVPTDLNLLLQRVQRIVALQADAAGVTITSAYRPLPLLSLNVFQVEQTILNLLNNALSALTSGGNIHISSDLPPDNRLVIIKISDTGSGFPLQELNSLVHPQNDQAREKGHGFGLFLSREVMQHHGGTLEIQSSRDTGTLITLCFPAPTGEV